MKHKQRLAFAAAMLAVACTKVPDAELTPGERPAIDSVEAGLWMQMDRVEDKLLGSGGLLYDPELENLLNDMACELEPKFCGDLRIYIVQTPAFNATMSPNGMMQIWTGLLLRVRSEAELAFVISHEISHFTSRHSLKRWVDLQNRADAASVFSIITAAAGVGFIGYASQMAAIAGSLAFSREQETEADQLGAQLMRDAGYDVRAAADIWRRVLAEQEAAGDEMPSVFLSTHPGINQRIKNLNELAQADLPPDAADERADRFLPFLDRYFGAWIDDEISKNGFATTQHLLNDLEASGRNAGEIAYYRGELHRKRGEDGNLKTALSHYRKAVESGAAPPEVHRQKGQLLLRMNRHDEAKQQLELYLAKSPSAPDSSLVESQIKGLN